MLVTVRVEHLASGRNSNVIASGIVHVGDSILKLVS